MELHWSYESFMLLYPKRQVNPNIIGVRGVDNVNSNYCISRSL
jgi:hypothetical protein